jgi:hypothetical protein
MATITLNVNNEINTEFRDIVKSKYGEGKGIIGKAIEEALLKWISEQKQKEISERQISILRKGTWDLKNYKFNREEIYEKRGDISC